MIQCILRANKFIAINSTLYLPQTPSPVAVFQTNTATL